MLILLKRLLDSGFIAVHKNESGSWLDGIKTTPDMIAITTKGREFIFMSLVFTNFSRWLRLAALPFRARLRRSLQERQQELVPPLSGSSP
jgi:hypothetical protein